jgi:hypothetical protein
VNHPRGASVHKDRLTVSSIYTCFKEGFEATDGGVIEHLNRYASQESKENLEEVWHISSNRQDWTLHNGH